MNAQQLLDYIIKPTLKYMGGGYNSKNAQMLLLATAAVESDCGHYIKQIGGPALGIWQMEPKTHNDIWDNCDALKDMVLNLNIQMLGINGGEPNYIDDLMVSPMFSCAMARLKYAMDPDPLPDHKKTIEIYRYYKRIYNTELGASTFTKFQDSWFDNKLNEIKL